MIIIIKHISIESSSNFFSEADKTYEWLFEKTSTQLGLADWLKKFFLSVFSANVS